MRIYNTFMITDNTSHFYHFTRKNKSCLEDLKLVSTSFETVARVDLLYYRDAIAFEKVLREAKPSLARGRWQIRPFRFRSGLDGELSLFCSKIRVKERKKNAT